MADNHDENYDLSTNDSIQAVIPVVKPKQKKQLSEKQLEALQRGRDARDAKRAVVQTERKEKEDLLIKKKALELIDKRIETKAKAPPVIVQKTPKKSVYYQDPDDEPEEEIVYVKRKPAKKIVYIDDDDEDDEPVVRRSSKKAEAVASAPPAPAPAPVAYSAPVAPRFIYY